MFDSSCPRLSRASTSCFPGRFKDVDGRDKPGHDVERASLVAKVGIIHRSSELVAGQRQHNDDEKDQSYSAARCITPASAVRPGGQRADQREYQHNDQDGSQHGRDLLVYGIVVEQRRSESRVPAAQTIA
jgi:hypothetical protein